MAGIFDPGLIDSLPIQQQITTSTSTQCDMRCLKAKGKSCNCKCGGVNHGWYWRTQLNPKEELVLNDLMPGFAKDFQGVKCPECGHPLDGEGILIKAHRSEDGLWNKWLGMRLAIYAVCPQCGAKTTIKEARRQRWWEG
ncbi:MAG: hypothetical protein QW580_02085 [Nitrososphaerota archaeon]